ncbi:tRNA(Ile)-lysidine synthase-like protein [Drosera capensis]
MFFPQTHSLTSAHSQSPPPLLAVSRCHQPPPGAVNQTARPPSTSFLPSLSRITSKLPLPSVRRRRSLPPEATPSFPLPFPFQSPQPSPPPNLAAAIGLPRSPTTSLAPSLRGRRAKMRPKTFLIVFLTWELDVKFLVVIGLMVAQSKVIYKKQLIFVDVCIKNQIGALLIAHHADDQAELFILRLSRNSGVLGLAGMAFSSQLFPAFPLSTGESSKIPGIILVRPLLDFSKEDLYKICREGDQKWVEDPSNKSASFARNRIRMELCKASTEYKTELQALISVCRRVRAYIDFACHDLINKAVNITDHGYAIVDLKILDPSNVGDLCLSKFMAAVLQFISQNHMQVRGNASNLLLDYIRMLPCKSSLTVAGCYLCAAPGSKGTKILVCSHSQSDLPLKVEWFPQIADELPHEFQHEIEQILAERKSYEPFLDDSDVCILNLSSSKSILDEGKKLKILSDSTYSGIIEMKMNETARFIIREPLITDTAKKDCPKMVNASQGLLRLGQSCYFMKRFLITWHSSEKSIRDANCCMCAHEPDMVANIRLMVDDDWMYLAKLAKDEVPSNYQYQHAFVHCDLTHGKEETKLVLDYRSLSAKQALLSLKSIPAAARRSLPVLVNQHQLLLSIPSVGFKQCPCLVVSVVFKPRVPLGGELER